MNFGENTNIFQKFAILFFLITMGKIIFSMSQFIDFRIIQSLLSRFGKKNFETLVNQEFGIDGTLLLPHEQAYYLELLAKEKKMMQALQENGLDKIYELECDIVSILVDMERIWVAFDAEKMRKIGTRIRADISALEGEIFEIIGEKINLNSPKQLQVFFFEKLGLKPIKKNKTGFSVDNDVLEEIAKTHDVARLILEYRSLSKLSSTYVEGLLKAIDMRDNRIHTRYDSLGTTTGRMSSNEPNLQNIPAGDGYAAEIKSCFVPSGGNILIVADYSQIELRILAFLSQDAGLLQAFKNGEDIHTRTAKFLFGEKEISSHERRIAKNVNFGVIYGITGFGLAKTLDCSPWEANKYIDAFYEKYPGVKSFYEKLLEEWRKNGYVETFFGRKRWVSALNDANKTMRAIAEREAMNMPIQGTAADILKLAMRDIFAKITEKWLQGKMILQVHDELVFDVPLTEKGDFEAIISKSMEDILHIQNLKHLPENMLLPPLLVDIWYGKNWVEAK